MFKEELNSTDIYSNRQEGDNQLLLKIQGADPKWAQLFLHVQNSDFKIQHRDVYYPVHRNVVFKNISLHVLDHNCQQGVLTLLPQFNPQMVRGVISCLYSLELKICRSQALQVLDIVYNLHIPKLQKKLQSDIKANIEDYQIFMLLEKSLLMGMSDIQEMCLSQLEQDNYEQMCYEKFQLLECNEETFKYVLHHHNERRWEDHSFGQGEKYIQEIVEEYCQHHGYSQRQKIHLNKSLKEINMSNYFPTFSKPKLSPLKINKEFQSPIQCRLYTPRAGFKDTLFPATKNSCSPFDNQEINSSKSMIFDLTYMGQKKKRKGSRNSEHSNPQSKIASDYIVLKEQNREMVDQVEKLRESLDKMSKTMKQKEVQCRNNTFNLGQIEGILEECENQMMEENKILMLLDVRMDKLNERIIDVEQVDSDVEGEKQVEGQVGLGESCDSENSEKHKVPNQKDQTLRVSLIQSKWVCC